jgi:hypothetical protein
LLDSMRNVGANEQAAALASRAATSTALDSPSRIASLLYSMRKAAANEQAIALANRLPAAGMYDLYRQFTAAQTRFGRDPNGFPARSWSWDDLR